jgi:quercetin dioxygenase-like cupin family protein
MTRYLEIDEAGFADAFGHRAAAVRHNLIENPLLSLDALAALAERLPDEQVEHNTGAVSEIVENAESIQRSQLTPAEIVRTIDTNGEWMVLKLIETVPEYKRLLDETLDEVSAHLPEASGPMLDREAFVFLSAPGSVTPSHTDPEHNILLQIRGRKQMNVGSFPDERTKQLELEDYAMGGHRNVAWKPVEPRLFDMHPGDAVYVPPHAPHWVKNGESASISLSITFRTPATLRATQVSSINARLRKLGLSPTPPGQRPGVDSAKAVLSGALSRLRGG